MTERIVPVNGYWIRQTLDPDFAIFHYHGSPLDRDYSRKPYVTTGELWVDYRYIDELPYLLRAQKKLAGLTGTIYRQKRQEILGEMAKTNRLDRREFIISEERRGFGLVISYVDGPKVRRHIDPEFVQGGHSLVYGYINQYPRQLWIDATMDPRDLPHAELHEAQELELMTKDHLSYDIAHEIAMAYEKRSRVAAGGTYPGFENPRGFTPQQLLSLYFDLTK